MWAERHCRRFTLGAFVGGWIAVCLDCEWSQRVTGNEDNYSAAKALGEQHVG